MARPARPWFRLYVEALHDRKLRRLTPSQRWLWVAVLGAARMSCRPGVLLVSERQPMDEHDLADIAAMPVRDVARALPLFAKAGLIERDGTGDAWRVVKWDDRQYESDNVTERTRKLRSKRSVGTPLERSNGDGTMFEGTPPDTETDTETETDRSFHAQHPLHGVLRRMEET